MPPQIDAAEIEKRFSSHSVGPEQQDQISNVRDAYKGAAGRLADLPESREKSLAFTALEESSFWANAAIAREGK